MKKIAIIPTSTGPKVFSTEEQSEELFKDALLSFFQGVFEHCSRNRSDDLQGNGYVRNLLNSNAVFRTNLGAALPTGSTLTIEDVKNFVCVQDTCARTFFFNDEFSSTEKTAVIIRAVLFQSEDCDADHADDVAFDVLVFRNGEGNFQGQNVPCRDLLPLTRFWIEEKIAAAADAELKATKTTEDSYTTTRLLSNTFNKIKKATKEEELEGLRLYAEAHASKTHDELFTKGTAFLAGVATGCLLMLLMAMLTV